MPEAMTDNEFLEHDRICKIQATIREHGEENFYLSFSGGRDSTILHRFLDIALPGNRIPRVFVNTGIEYAEIVKFVKKLAETDDRIVIVNAGVNISKMLEEKGYPVGNKHTSQTWYRYRIKGNNAPYIWRWARAEPIITKAGNEITGYSPYLCPLKLMEITKPDWDEFLISDNCCKELKIKPLRQYEKESGRNIAITGMLAAEGGRRRSISCLAFANNKLLKFHPFAPVKNDFLDYLAQKYNIELCKLYYPPYNFKRTGCKGCPFNPRLKHDLDVMEAYFPAERKQCETIFGKVYDLYRKVGFRHMDEPEGTIEPQLLLWEALQ